jgi:DNA-binding PadR family transcriptional regulator
MFKEFWHEGPFEAMQAHFGRFGHGRGRRRFKRGMLKYVLLRLISDAPRHGYDLMRFFGERGWGALAAGTLYPLLDKLEQAGFVEGREEDGRRVYSVTEAGRERLRRVAQDLKDEFSVPFDADEPDEEPGDDLREAFKKLAAAIYQTGRETAPETRSKITEILKNARKEIYTLLANE